MGWDHPHTARVRSGKGPKGKRQRRLARERAERERRGLPFEERKSPDAAKHDFHTGTLASIGWRP